MTFFILLLIAVAIAAAIVAMQPSDFRITRTAKLYAPASAVFAQVNDLHNWGAWSPWVRMDPAAQSIFSGSPAGTGAVMKWASNNNKVGEGIMTITESNPYEAIGIKLEFLNPFKATNRAEFTFKPNGNHTVVTWSTYGKNNFMGKAINLIFNCDKMIGSQFEKGLKNLSEVVQKAPKN